MLPGGVSEASDASRRRLRGFARPRPRAREAGRRARRARVALKAGVWLAEPPGGLVPLCIDPSITRELPLQYAVHAIRDVHAVFQVPCARADPGDPWGVYISAKGNAQGTTEQATVLPWGVLYKGNLGPLPRRAVVFNPARSCSRCICFLNTGSSH
jgi:hypothetical protein